jgi:hypothetical protein
VHSNYEIDLFRALIETAHAAGVRTSLVTDRAVRAMSDTVTPPGVIAVCDLLDVSLASAVTAETRLLAVPVAIADPGNAGTVIRVADAVFASCALPGYFPPHEIGGRFFVDGAVVANVPFVASRALGPELIVAVDVSASSVLTADPQDEGFAGVFRQAGVKFGLLLRGKRFWVDTRSRPSIEDQYQIWIDRHEASPGDGNVEQMIAGFASAPLVSVLTVLDAGDARRVETAQGDRGILAPGRRLQDRDARPGDPRRGEHPGPRAVGTHRDGGLRDVLPVAGRGDAADEE